MGVNQNNQKLDSGLDRPELRNLLNDIRELDQKCRQNIEATQKKYGKESCEMKILTRNIRDTDSINLSRVKKILDYYGWLGPDDVGEDGSFTLFLVLQHADLQTQLNYLPILKDAIQNNKAKAGYLAMMEDRIATTQGKKQIYGTQIGSKQTDSSSIQYYILPLEDPDNVDKRREFVGLEPLSDYVKHWNIQWDVEQYKKDLPSLMKLQK